jgi:hypothetical protein
MRIIFILSLIAQLKSSFLTAQLLSPVGTGCAGRSVSVESIILEDHIGFVWTKTINNPSFVYTQGLLQPDAGTTGVVPYINDILLIGGNFIIDAQGSTVENAENNFLMEYTLGEMASITMSTSQNMLTQGILQPKSCTPVLTLTPTDLPLMGSYQARDEIIISGAISVKEHNVIFNAPLITVQGSLKVHETRLAIANSNGCVTN